MYASSVDYKTLYSTEYFGKTLGASSFAADTFSNELSAFCEQNEIKHVLDVGSGSGALAHQLRAGGIDVFTCDFEPATADSVHFDLTGPKEEANRIHDLMRERTSGRPWLVTCLDVLEHMDIEHVFNATSNLHALSTGFLLTSISTRPSSRDNRFHTTILPIQTWISILKLVGFTLENDQIFANTRTVRKNFAAADGLELVAHWAQADPFGDIDDGEPSYVLLSVGHHDPDVNGLAACEHILDIAFRRIKRAQFTIVNPPTIALNIHHPQDFILLRPILDVMPRHNVVALIRRSFLRNDELSLMRGFFARSGMRVIEYHRAEEILWSDFDVRFLLSGGESSVAPSHILSRQVIESAKLNGIQTLQLQHGIWADTFHERIPTFGSTSVLAWGSQYENGLKTGEYNLANTTLRGLTGAITQYRSVGAAKFTDSTLAPSKEVAKFRLGLNTENYRLLVLLGTNLKWGAHQQEAGEIRNRLIKVMEALPDVFFVIKLHPSERISDAAGMKLTNSLLLDDMILGCMDLHVSRLLSSFDVVISSLSTLLLDASVASIPCIQYDTGNSYSYQGIRAVAIEEIPLLLSRPKENLEANIAVTNYYANSAQSPFYSELADILSTPNVATEPDTLSAATFYSVAATLEDQLASANQAQEDGQKSTQQLREDKSKLQDDLRRSIEDLESARAATAAAVESCETAKTLTTELKKAVEDAQRAAEIERNARDAMQSSKSWTITAPLRALRRLVQRA